MPAEPPEPVGSPEPAEVAPEGTRRGLDVAREALAAARAEARRRGQEPVAGRRRRTPQRRSGARPDDRDPQPLGATLDRLLADRGWEVDLAVGGVMGRWDEVVGAEVAGHCRPETFDDGELGVVTDTTAWATQVRLLVPALVRRLNEELGDGTVRRVRVRGPEAPSWRRGALRVDGRGPRDTYG